MSSYLLTQKQDIFQPFQDGELVITKIIIIAYSRLSVNKRERNSTRRNRRVSEKAGEVWDGSKSLTGVYMILRPDSDLSGFFFFTLPLLQCCYLTPRRLLKFFVIRV